ncbi:sugar ABC transporter substrate-binding protein [Heyndrickxia sp. NPDC080065]|uniref:sugar ABC transporter substrate-binding protein n=1 Tax=Heyndrickxia sp. NPDC080065 TaxID=3390568 RepID=UPI003D032C17
MVMKKVLSVLTTGVLMAGLMAGCSKPGESAGTTKKDPAKANTEAVEAIQPEEGAKLLLWDNGGSEGKWAKAVAKEFTAKYNVPVKVAEVSHTDAAAKLKTDGPAGLGADVFDSAHDHLGELVTAGLVRTNYFAPEYKGKYLDQALEASSYINPDTDKKELYGFPIAVETYALFYNKKLVQEPATTWDDLLTQSKKITDKKQNKFGIMFEPSNYYFLHAFVGGYGGYEFGDNGTNAKDIGLNNDGAVKAGEFVKKIHDEVLPLKAEDITGDAIGSLFNENKLAYKITGPWDVEGLKKAKVDFGVVPLPKLDNGEPPKSFMGVKSYYVSAYTKYPKAATLLAQFASSKEMEQKRFEMTGQLPAENTVLDSDVIKNDSILSAFLEQVKVATPMPSIPEMQSVWAAMGTAFTTIWNKGADVKQTLDNAVKQIQDGISSTQK